MKLTTLLTTIGLLFVAASVVLLVLDTFLCLPYLENAPAVCNILNFAPGLFWIYLNTVIWGIPILIFMASRKR